ncbi:MAG TPA: FecR domain-containing protein, partial [Terriglobales bacterium]|nr:FecR domain-containing protein [Terriglobales bacterium]
MKHNFLVPVFSLGFLTALSSAQVDVSPGVARISLIQGDVSVQRGDTGDWAAAALNQPLVAGDSISTGDNSKAELQLDHANILRLSDNSQAKIATLERVQNQRVQVQIWHGLAYYTVFKDSEAEVEIDTPNAAIRPTSKDGVYRIEVTGFETQVIVRAGGVDLSTPQG